MHYSYTLKFSRKCLKKIQYKLSYCKYNKSCNFFFTLQSNFTNSSLKKITEAQQISKSTQKFQKRDKSTS